MIEIDHLSDITQAVWETMFAAMPEPLGLADAPPVGCKVGYIELSGVQSGRVGVCVPEPMLRRAAAMMFGSSEDELAPTDCEDALKEMANMVGGNMKCLIEPPPELSLPVVVDGADFDGLFGSERGLLAFAWSGGTFCIASFTGELEARTADLPGGITAEEYRAAAES